MTRRWGSGGDEAATRRGGSGGDEAVTRHRGSGGRRQGRKVGYDGQQQWEALAEEWSRTVRKWTAERDDKTRLVAWRVKIPALLLSKIPTALLN